MNNCLNCNNSTPNAKFCSHSCQRLHEYHEYIDKWKDGLVDGVRGPGQTSKHIKRYLVETLNNTCSSCGINSWNGKDIVMDLEHIDGDSDNNRPENLTLLCPNCHSQSPTFKNRNKGKGRHARRQRYAEGKSF